MEENIAPSEILEARLRSTLLINGTCKYDSSNDPCHVAKSKQGDGRGVFASANIAKGEYITIYPAHACFEFDNNGEYKTIMTSTKWDDMQLLPSAQFVDSLLDVYALEYEGVGTICAHPDIVTNGVGHLINDAMDIKDFLEVFISGLLPEWIEQVVLYGHVTDELVYKLVEQELVAEADREIDLSKVNAKWTCFVEPSNVDASVANTGDAGNNDEQKAIKQFIDPYGLMHVIATRDIAKDEEILVSYGMAYWPSKIIPLFIEELTKNTNAAPTNFDTE